MADQDSPDNSRARGKVAEPVVPARKSAADTVRKDADGQFADVDCGGDNSGLSAATPRVTSDGENTGADWDAQRNEESTPDRKT